MQNLRLVVIYSHFSAVFGHRREMTAWLLPAVVRYVATI